MLSLHREFTIAEHELNDNRFNIQGRIRQVDIDIDREVYEISRLTEEEI